MSARAKLFAAGGLVALAALGAAGVLARGRVVAVAAATGAGPAALRVLVAEAKPGAPVRQLDLQGEARPFASVTLYSKVSGYLREIRVDRGAEVAAGQILAVIEAPEIERQHQAAVADAAFKRASARSAAALTELGAIARRQVEAEAASADVAEAVLAGAESQRALSILRAPFRGTVTARFADPGALVQSAANASSGALPVVTVSDTRRLRVHAYVDQRHAGLVKIGDPARISVPDAGVEVEGRIARRSGELDARTRSMLVEVDLDNRAGAIVAGSFVRVRVEVKTPALVDVPVEALALRDQQAFVPVVTGTGKARRIALRPVVIGHFDGALCGLRAGVAAGELVALHLGRSAVDGAEVESVLSAPRAAAR